MNSDAIIDIGSTHGICQDYAIAKRDYVIVSDGCSSSPDTDIGARLLVRALDQDLSARPTTEIAELHANAARTALAWADAIGLPPQCVDATLLSAHVTNEELIIACSGDGVIILETQSGGREVHPISSPSGYPSYPAYLHQPDRLSEMVAHDRCTETIVFKLNVADYKYAAIASDGLTSFFHTQQTPNGKRVEPVRLADVLTGLWSFKNSHGAFVQRRLKRFKKDTHWQHADDLALAVLHLGDDDVRQDSQNVLAT
jgi:serine/threonine protein phosphatase PrpC